MNISDTCNDILASCWFDGFLTLSIIASATMMALHLEMEDDMADVRPIIYWIITGVFTFELLIKIVAEGLYPRE